jgi:signal transduction histidine kinase
MPSRSQSSKAKLRERALARLNSSTPPEPTPPVATAPPDSLSLLHELQVHQIELEMQNEALRYAHQEAEAALQRYTDLYELAPTGYFTLDRHGVVMQNNLAGAALVALAQTDLHGTRFSSFVLEGDAPRFNAWLERAFTAPQHREVLEVGLNTPDLQTRTVQMVSVLLPDEASCCVSLVDISERRLLEIARLRVAAQEVERLGAEGASKAKSAFLSRMSHELRTPLNAMMGFTQLLKLDKTEPLTDMQARRVNAVLLAGGELIALIESVLGLASIDAGSLQRQEAAETRIGKLVDPGRTT